MIAGAGMKNTRMIVHGLSRMKANSTADTAPDAPRLR